MDLVGLEEAQQLGLHVERHVGNLVEKERAAGRSSDDAGERGVGAGERATAVAEQLALDHVAGHRGAVERDDRPVGAIRRAVNRAREHFLARAGLAGDQDRQRARRDSARDAEHFGHLLGRPDAFGVALERFGRPQRRALLLVAPVAIERQRRGNQLADGDERAAVLELRLGVDDQLPGLVAMLPERDHLARGRLARAGERRGFVPAAAVDDAGAIRTRRDDGCAARALCRVDYRERLAREDVRVAPELDECYRAVEVWGGGVKFAFVTSSDFRDSRIVYPLHVAVR